MLAKVQSAAVVGVDAFDVEIEVNAGGGDYKFVVVGLPDAAVKESVDQLRWQHIPVIEPAKVAAGSRHA